MTAPTLKQWSKVFWAAQTFHWVSESNVDLVVTQGTTPDGETASLVFHRNSRITRTLNGKRVKEARR